MLKEFLKSDICKVTLSIIVAVLVILLPTIILSMIAWWLGLIWFILSAVFGTSYVIWMFDKLEKERRRNNSSRW